MDFLTDLCHLHDRKIILASQSPRRIEMLRQLGLRFEIRPAQTDEQPAVYSDAIDFVRHVALEKAEWVWDRSPADLIIAADTIVTMEGEIFGKPADRAAAREVLLRLGGHTHEVITGICLKTPTMEILDQEITRVTFHPLTEAEVDQYLDSGEPFDKAGAYGIQGLASLFVRRVEGCYFNVIGFPVARFYQHLRELSW